MKEFFAKFDKVFTNIIEWFLAVAFAVMVILVFVNVCGRYILGKGITESEEIARMLFVWLTYVGAVLVFKTKSHVMVDILLVFLHGVPRKIVDIIGNLLLGTILAVTFYYSLNLIKANLNLLSPLVKIPMYIVEGIIPVCFLIMFIMNIFHLIGIITTKYEPAPTNAVFAENQGEEEKK